MNEVTSIKPWGISRRLLSASHVQVERIEFIKGGFTSIHEHHGKYNLFYVLRGILSIRTFSVRSMRRGEPFFLGEIILGPGSAPFIIAPRMVHQFIALDDGEGLEVYVASEASLDLPGDIFRYTENGNAMSNVP